MNLASGRIYDLSHIIPLKTDEIAFTLSRTIRWGRQAKTNMSVAEHSLRVASFSSHFPEALLHDCAEVILGNIPSPVKAVLPGARDLEEKIRQMTVKAMGYDPSLVFSEIDTKIREWEFQHIFYKSYPVLTAQQAEHAFWYRHMMGNTSHWSEVEVLRHCAYGPHRFTGTKCSCGAKANILCTHMRWYCTCCNKYTVTGNTYYQLYKHPHTGPPQEYFT